jgi:hypothetical protein
VQTQERWPAHEPVRPVGWTQHSSAPVPRRSGSLAAISDGDYERTQVRQYESDCHILGVEQASRPKASLPLFVVERIGTEAVSGAVQRELGRRPRVPGTDGYVPSNRAFAAANSSSLSAPELCISASLFSLSTSSSPPAGCCACVTSSAERTWMLAF